MEVPENMVGAQNFPALIRELHTELRLQRASEVNRWRASAHETAMRRILSPHAFLDWAKQDRHWSFTLAEVMREAVARPAELAARLLVAMLEELEEERETQESELTPEALSAAAYAD
jgi:hypothetical protein